MEVTAHKNHEGWYLLAKVALFAVLVVALPKLVIYLDQARIVAYVIVPSVLYIQFFRPKHATWRAQPLALMAFHSVNVIYVLCSYYLVLVALSIEAGDPKVSSGVIYDLAKLMTLDSKYVH